MTTKKLFYAIQLVFKKPVCRIFRHILVPCNSFSTLYLESVLDCSVGFKGSFLHTTVRVQAGILYCRSIGYWRQWRFVGFLLVFIVWSLFIDMNMIIIN